MQSKATTVDEYLASLPDDRRAAIQAVRRVILDNLDADFEEGMQYGMIGYFVPHRAYPAGYHCNPREPLPFASLASQKHYMSLYLMSVYGEGPHWKWFHDAWARTGKKLDMGKCCIRFKRLEDLALEVIAEAFQRTSAQQYIERYETVLRTVRSRKPAKQPARTKKPPVKPKPAGKSTAKRPHAAKKKSSRKT